MSAAEFSHPQDPLPRTDYSRVWLLSLAHFTNDAYGSSISSLMPYLVLAGRISTAAAGFVLLIYLIGSSVLQPIIGLVSDRTGSRIFATLGPIWVGVAAALIGLATGSFTLLAVAAIGGIGTAAFHPQAASMVNRLSGRKKGGAMAIFSVGGNVGFACGPLIAAAIALVGLHWSPVIVLPGLLLTVLLIRYAPDLSRHEVQLDAAELRREFARSWASLSLIVSVIAVRSSVQFGLILFLPLYYHARGASAQLGSTSAFVFSLFGALGGLAGGYLSDRYGRKIVVVPSLLLATPILLAGLQPIGYLSWPLLALGGGCLLASNSVTIVQGQERLPQSTGIASGLTLGLGFGLSGVCASILTSLAGHIGVEATIHIVPLLSLGAAALSAFVPETHRPHVPSPYPVTGS